MEALEGTFRAQRKAMKDTSSIGIADILATREDYLIMPRTSSGQVRENTKSKLNTIVIVGKVRDNSAISPARLAMQCAALKKSIQIFSISLEPIHAGAG